MEASSSKLLHRIVKFIKMQIYAYLFKINENATCFYFAVDLIFFFLSDRAGWGLQNFYTKLPNSLIMLIYSKSIKMLSFLYFTADLIMFFSDRAGWGFQTGLLHRIVKFINYANLFKISENCHLFSVQK